MNFFRSPLPKVPVFLLALGFLSGSVAATGKRPNSSECVVVIESFLRFDEVEDNVFLCKLDPLDTNGAEHKYVPIDLTDSQQDIFQSKAETLDLVSGLSTLKFEDDIQLSVSGDRVLVPADKKTFAFGTTSGGRRLGTRDVEGIKPILAVKIIDVNGLQRQETPLQIQDDIFGTRGDTLTLASQMYDCSHGKLQIVPGVGNPKETVPGVLVVNIDKDITIEGKGPIRDAAIAKAGEILGHELPGPYDQVMFIQEKCYQECGWAAYAWGYSWLTFYQKSYFKEVGVQMHELGHNFGLAHSGRDGGTYSDKTCHMGTPQWGDDNGAICYNPAKSWQIGWYNSHKLLLDPRQQAYWEGEIIGVADFSRNDFDRPVVVKIETTTHVDLYVGFNRATGANRQNNKEAGDEVTVVETGRNGERIAQSWLKATLKEGESYTVEDWQGLGRTLYIIAEEIDLGSDSVAGYARVSICLGICWSPTATPTQAPTRAPLDVSYQFPPVATSQFVHGLCVLGASKARATSDDPLLTYTSIPNFADDVQLWTNRDYKASGIDSEDYCKGGTYLQPSLHKAVDEGTEIIFEADTNNGESVTLCVFLVPDWRDGEWDVSLVDDGFTMTTGMTWYPEPFGSMRSYCKTLSVAPSPPSPDTRSPTLSPTLGPTVAPSPVPTLSPTERPTLTPTKRPTLTPTKSPTQVPTKAPSPDAFNLSYTFPKVTTSQFVHGLCVLGASEAQATSDDPQLTYTNIPNFGDDVQLWANRGYKALGINNEDYCKGGTYLQPSLHKSVDVNTEIVFEAKPSNGQSVTLCAFVVTDWRDGRWDVELPSDGFTLATGMTWYPAPLGAMRSYCKTISGSTPAPTAAPTPTRSLSYTFPKVTTSQFVHGLCVLGASEAQATSDDPQLTYTNIPNFGDDVQLWANRGYKALGINNEDYCKGGTYLQPSLHKSVDVNTEIVFEAKPSNGQSVTLCAFVVTDWRDGQWDVELPADGFTLATGMTWYPAPLGAMRSYCKTLLL